MIYQRRMTLIALLGLAALSSGCANTGTFNNEVVCGEAGTVRFISFYGPVGVAAKVDKSAVTCPVFKEVK
jgi:hypothetical protein